MASVGPLKRGPGRPTKPPAECHTEALWIYATPAQAEEVFQRAIRAKTSISKYLASLVFQYKENHSDKD